MTVPRELAHGLRLLLARDWTIVKPCDRLSVHSELIYQVWPCAVSWGLGLDKADRTGPHRVSLMGDTSPSLDWTRILPGTYIA